MKHFSGEIVVEPYTNQQRRDAKDVAMSVTTSSCPAVRQSRAEEELAWRWWAAYKD